MLARWIDSYADPATYHWVIELKSAAQAIGYIYLNEFNEAANSAAVHFALGRAFWHQGIMSEACGAVIAFAFSILQRASIHSRHHIDNPASGRVLQKCGMRHIRTAYREIPDCARISGNYCYYEISNGG